VAVFADRIGFFDLEKQGKLAKTLAAYKRKLNREPFSATLLSLTPDREEAVYDVQVPGSQCI
jgi:hypothetical protein